MMTGKDEKLDEAGFIDKHGPGAFSIVRTQCGITRLSLESTIDTCEVVWCGKPMFEIDRCGPGYDSRSVSHICRAISAAFLEHANAIDRYDWGQDA